MKVMRLRNFPVGAMVIICGITILMLYFLTKPSSENKQRIIAKHRNKKHEAEDLIAPDGAALQRNHGNIKTLEMAFEQEKRAFLKWKAEEEDRLNDARLRLKHQEEELQLERNLLEDEKEELAAAVRLGFADKTRNKKETAEARKKKDKFIKDEYLNSIGGADPQQFLGLNSSQVRSTYPGIVFLPNYQFRNFINPSEETMGMQGEPRSLQDMDLLHAEERFYELIGSKHLECADIERFGNQGDGGWDLCVSKPFTPTQEDCLVYSFGIDNDFSFDDGIAGSRGCKVKAFDPSMTYADHKHSTNVWYYRLGIGSENTVNADGWKLETFTSILTKAGHMDTVIDVLKMDIDYNEWSVLESMFSEGVLKHVKQLVLEIHTPEVTGVQKPATKQDYYAMYNTLLGLEKLGFRKCHVHYNQWGSFLSHVSGKHRTCCYEFTYLNLHFL